MIPPLWQKVKRNLKVSIQKMKIMAPGPITAWEIDGETAEIAFIFLGSKIIAVGDCSHEIKRCYSHTPDTAIQPE